MVIAFMSMHSVRLAVIHVQNYSVSVGNNESQYRHVGGLFAELFKPTSTNWRETINKDVTM